MQLAEQLGITQKTAWFVNHRIREMLKDAVGDKFTDTVEADESFIGGKNKNRHKDEKVENSQGRSFKDKMPVVGILKRAEYEIIEREHKVIKGKTVKEKVILNPSRVICQVVSDTQQKSVVPVIDAHVEQGANVYSDEWTAYNNLSENYNHSIVNHSVKEYVNGMVHTNGIEGFWSILKRGYVGIYHYMSKGHLQSYVDEFVLRFNTRKFDTQNRFNFILSAVSNKRLTYKELIK